MSRTRQIINTNNNGFTYCTPPDDEVEIPKIHLVSQLQKYKDALKQELTIEKLVGILGLWLPIFTSEFKGILGMAPDMVKGGYIFTAIIFTAFLIKPIYISIGKNMYKPWAIKYETDAEKRVENILK